MSITFQGISKLLKTVPVNSLKVHPKNPRLHDERNIQVIMRSLKDYKQLTPLVVWGKQNYVIAGNGRLEAMRRLGQKTVEIIRADHLSEAQALEYMVVDNKSTDLSEFDFQRVVEIMGTKGVDPLASGFADYEIEPLISGADLAAPKEFNRVDDNIDVEHKCPKCGYEWSGSH